MYSKEIIDFFKRNKMYDKDMFDYLQSHTDMIDYRDEDARMFIGCAYGINKETGKLDRFSLCIPFVENSKTALIAIHEIVHGIIGYKYLNKKFKKDMSIEVLPLLFERVYINEVNDPDLTNYADYLDSIIENGNDESYKIALEARNELLDKYSNNLNRLDRLSKKLVKKYKKAR